MDYYVKYFDFEGSVDTIYFNNKKDGINCIENNIDEDEIIDTNLY